MRSLYRTMPAGLARDVALICAADALVAVAFGSISVAGGLPVWFPVLASVAVFAGASQFLLLAVVTSGGSLVAAVAAGLLVNARHVPFGFTVADLLGPGPRRLLGTHVMTDESVAFALAQPDPGRRRIAYWTSGLALYVTFALATLAGTALGRAIGDPTAWGLDAAFPAVILALVVPALRERGVRLAAAGGAVVAVAASFVLPAGLPVLLALVAVPLASVPLARSR
jgi:predicted branched-subunit amino acid permease